MHLASSPAPRPGRRRALRDRILTPCRRALRRVAAGAWRRSARPPSRPWPAALAALLLCTCVVDAAAAPAYVEARGLMRDRALLQIDGRERLLRVGEVSPEGVELLAADARRARIRFDGREVELALSERVGANFVAPQTREVRITRDHQGQFHVAGTIAGQPVQFLVDTGATILAMSGNQASALGIDYREAGQAGQVVTAGGNAMSHFLVLDEVQVGGITVRNVQAAVVEGAYPQEILLGMSFLRHVGLSEQAGVLTIQQKF